MARLSLGKDCRKVFYWLVRDFEKVPNFLYTNDVF